MPMKILLHVCCAPCLIYPLKRLREQGFEAKGFFYNPNIQPYEEYLLRYEAAVSLSKDLGFEMDYPEYSERDFTEAIDKSLPAPTRCVDCWGLRMNKTASYARENGFDAFSSTLLVSPYQDQEILKRCGEAAARKAGVSFYYEDFRSGFREAHREAKEKGLYMQKYCGCVYSISERGGRKKR